MDAQSPGASAPIKTAFLAVSAAHDSASLVYSCFAELGALFTAIGAASAPFSQPKTLAAIGSYLAQDWANLHDCQREELAAKCDELRALLSSPVIEEVRHVA